MKIEKQFAVAATQDRVWAFITDPNLIGPCIPGCQDVEVLSPGRYRASLKIQVGPIKTTFAVIVEARVERPPEYAEYALQGEEGGKASRLSAVNTLAITRLTDTECEVKYISEVNLVGRLGKFGSGVMQKISDNLGEKFAQALRAGVEEVLPPVVEEERVRVEDSSQEEARMDCACPPTRLTSSPGRPP